MHIFAAASNLSQASEADQYDLQSCAAPEGTYSRAISGSIKKAIYGERQKVFTCSYLARTKRSLFVSISD